MQRLKLMAIIVVIVILQTIPATISTSAQPSGDQCVQAIQQEYFNVNIAAITLNVQTGQASFSAGPVIPPDAMFSPDGKYAVFWQHTKPGRASLYIANVSTGNAVFLYETESNHWTVWRLYYKPQLWAWAPDSSTFAYIQSTAEYYMLKVVSADGLNKQESVVMPANSKTDGYALTELYGFSADGAYLAVGTQNPLWTEYDKPRRRQVRIWSAESLSPVITLASWGGYGDDLSPVAWSPQGHQLALPLDTSDRSPARLGDLAIWSPEKGIETRLEVAFYDDYYEIFWSPNGKMIWLHDYWGHSEGDNNLYYLNNGKLTGKPTDQVREFLGWSGEESALVYDSMSGEEHTELVNINVRNGARKVIDRAEPYGEHFAASPNGKWIAYIVGEGSVETGVNFHAAVVAVDSNNKRQFFETHIEPSSTTYIGRSVEIFWSPNGQYIALDWSYQYPDSFTIVTTPDGSVTHKLPAGALTWIRDPWAFYEIEAENGTTIQLINVETDQRFDLFSPSDKADPEKQGLMFASIAPDGQTIAGAVNEYSVALYNVATQMIRRVPISYITVDYSWLSPARDQRRYSEWTQYTLSWSPDSTMLAYVENTDTSSELVVLNRHGETVQRLNVNSLRNMDSVFYGPVQWIPCSRNINRGTLL